MAFQSKGKRWGQVGGGGVLGQVERCHGDDLRGAQARVEGDSGRGVSTGTF